jgi:hypothetical protein
MLTADPDAGVVRPTRSEPGVDAAQDFAKTLGQGGAAVGWEWKMIRGTDFFNPEDERP